MPRYLEFNFVQNVFNKSKRENFFVALPTFALRQNFEKYFLKSRFLTRFKHNPRLNKRRMRFKLFYTFIFLYWSILVVGPFIN